ncbi:hypothetical protein ACFQYP_49190 [Nonomuraea antimicrobica]
MSRPSHCTTGAKCSASPSPSASASVRVALVVSDRRKSSSAWAGSAGGAAGVGGDHGSVGLPGGVPRVVSRLPSRSAPNAARAVLGPSPSSGRWLLVAWW